MKTVTNGKRKTVLLEDVTPEAQAYAFAAYSRSDKSILDAIGHITKEGKASKFLETFYFAYGHKSIADMAHVALAFENISTIAATVLENEQLWDGQEKSTRYQDFSGAGFYTPDSLSELDSEQYEAANRKLFDLYNATFNYWLQLLEAHCVKEGLEFNDSLKRTLKARVLDIFRIILPSSTLTSVGQVVSARTLEKQLGRILAGGGEGYTGAASLELSSLHKDITQAINTPNGVPTLAKYASKPIPSYIGYRAEFRAELLRVCSDALKAFGTERLNHYDNPILNKFYSADNYYNRQRDFDRPLQDEVDLVDFNHYSPTRNILALALYQFVPGLQLKDSLEIINNLESGEFIRLGDLFKRAKGEHDEWLPITQFVYGNGLVFDVEADLKSLQDFFRHRRMNILRQDIFPTGTLLSYDIPEGDVWGLDFKLWQKLVAPIPLLAWLDLCLPVKELKYPDITKGDDETFNLTLYNFYANYYNVHDTRYANADPIKHDKALLNEVSSRNDKLLEIDVLLRQTQNQALELWLKGHTMGKKLDSVKVSAVEAAITTNGFSKEVLATYPEYEQAVAYKNAAAYMLPFGTRRRALFSMDLGQLAYFTKTRTQTAGHPAYRRLAYLMGKKAGMKVQDYLNMTEFKFNDQTNFFVR